MKLILNFISSDDDIKPAVGDEIIYLTKKHWYLETYKGELIPADVTHWAKIDMGELI